MSPGVSDTEAMQRITEIGMTGVLPERRFDTKKTKLALVGILAMFGGTVFSGCIADAKDNFIAGMFGAWEDAGGDFMDLLIVDFNEVFESTPDATLMDTP